MSASGTLSSVNGELKNRFGKSFRVFTRRISTAHVPTSFAILIFRAQTDDTFTLSSGDTTYSDNVSDNNLFIALRKGKHS